MRRTLYFLVTKFAVLIVLGTVLRLLGAKPYLTQQGLSYKSLLIFAAVFSMGGDFVSLVLSKWTAKRVTGAKVVTSPVSGTETGSWKP